MLLPSVSSLHGWVDSYWLYERSGPAPPSYEFPSLAPELALCVRGHIAFTLRDGKRREVSRSTLFGHLSGPMRLDLSGVDRMVVVRFAPRGVSSVLPFAQSTSGLLALAPALPAKDVFGPSLARLEEALRHLAPEALAAELDEWLTSRRCSDAPHFVADVGGLLNRVPSVSALSCAVGASRSTVERYFRRETGLSPKAFLIRNRFRRVVAEILSGAPDWIDLATRYGYVDQSHLIQEVRRFSGFTPVRLERLSMPTERQPDGFLLSERARE